MVPREMSNCVSNRKFRSNIFLDLASQCRLSACCDNIWLTWDCNTDAILSICFSFELLFWDSIALKYAFYVSRRFSTFKVSKNLENRLKMDEKKSKNEPRPFFRQFCSAKPYHLNQQSRVLPMYFHYQYFICSETSFEKSLRAFTIFPYAVK